MTPDGDTIRVLIADDDPVVRAVLVELVTADPRLALAGVASDAAEAVELATATQPHVAVLDWAMPGGGGPVAARDILELDCDPPVRILGLTGHDSEEASVDMLRAGAVNFVVKGSPDLAETIRDAALG